ncbi:MAG: LruC domain-containing protein [Pedobacter sp.]
MKTKLLAILLIFSIITSCEKNNLPENIQGPDINNLSASPAFSWATSRDVNFNIGISDTQFGSKLHVISIYSADPKNGGTLLSRGSASITSSFNTKISIPNTIKEVYLERFTPNGEELSQTIAVTTDKVSVSIGQNNIVTSSGLKPTNAAISAVLPIENSPSCTSGCGVIIQQSSQNSFDMNANTIYCVTGSNITVKVQNTNGGTMRICGTGVTVEGLKMTNNVTVIVAAGASVTFNNLNWEGPSVFKNFGTVSTGNVKVLSPNFLNQGTMNVNGDFVTESNGDGTNYGTINVSSNFNSGGTFTNEGTLKVNGNFNSSNTPTFVNNDILETKQTTIAGKFTNTGNWTVSSGEVSLNNSPTVVNTGIILARNSKVNASGTFTNGGSVTVQNYVQNSGTLINNCKLITLDVFDNNSEVLNTSYIQVDNESNLKGSTILRNGALFKTNVISSLDGTLKGEGRTSLFKVVSTSRDNINNGGKKITGTIVYADPSNKIKSEAFNNPAVATTGNGIYIEKNECNEGNGKQVVSDTDGDGIPDVKDAFPTDPDKAFINYSFNYNDGGTTIAFEDNFPTRGDYDMNDIVLTYRYQVISNAANKVVHVDADYSLRASGGSYKNGAGIQFDLPLASVSNVKGAQVEEQPVSKDLVLILFKDSRAQQSLWGTIVSEGASAPVNYDISFDVKPEISVEQFGIGNYNPFIWNNTPGFGRGYETHLKNKKPTDLADLSLFQSGDDGTIGKGQVGAGYMSYVSKTQNLPWAIELPISNFKYPVEKVAITAAYQSFSNWASSLGQNNIDWYSDGNVDNTKIYPIK